VTHARNNRSTKIGGFPVLTLVVHVAVVISSYLPVVLLL
jgi:hypothetical protein